jgi:demethylmenaquinone methyltransferase/2-methoxy-6-polyprenyl-1,4-benzoquinol methylase
MVVEVQQRPWVTTGEERRAYVRSMFGRIAGVYDLLNSLMTFGSHRRWRRHAVRLLELRPGAPALDVCCGTGDFAFELAAAGAGAVVALDFSGEMIEVGRRKSGIGNRESGMGSGEQGMGGMGPSSHTRHPTCEPRHPVPRTPYPVPCTPAWLLADALRLPLKDATVEVATVGWGLRNLSDIQAGLAEIHRVLRPGGRFVALDMAKPRGRAGRVAATVARRVVPLLGALLGNREAYTYLPKSVESFPEREELSEMARRVGFASVDTHDLALGVVCIHRGVKA